MERDSIGKSMTGKKEEYLNLGKDKELLDLVWNWVEKKVNDGKPYLNWALLAMLDGLGKPDWREIKEELMYYGPDNFQLDLPRHRQEQVKLYWWKLVKYQYNTLKEKGEI